MPITDNPHLTQAEYDKLDSWGQYAHSYVHGDCRRLSLREWITLWWRRLRDRR